MQENQTKTEGLAAVALHSLVSLRSKLFEYIRKALAEDGHCKSYEGTFEIRMPSYFDDSHNPPNGDEWAIVLHCYVIGPSRHYEWRGGTLNESVLKAEKEINSWLTEWDAEREQANTVRTGPGHAAGTGYGGASCSAIDSGKA